MDYLPVFLDIRNKKVIVQGNGSLASRRVERALSAGAEVWLFAADPGEEMNETMGHARLTHFARDPQEHDFHDCAMAYGTTENPIHDERLHAWATKHGALCNVVDAPDLCDFISPSIVDRSPITVAISTSGAAPVIARILRARLEAMLPPAMGRLANFASGYRDRIANTITSGTARRRFWENMIDGPAGDSYLFGNEKRASDMIEDGLARAAQDEHLHQGEVYLVGAGPGDPDLLSFRALRLMQRCDVVLHDRLLGDGILSLVRRDAERIFVGKKASDHSMQQEDIQTLMVKLAEQGKRVLRLKGGDPFIFGRGGEEIETLAQHNIPFQVVPGVTAAAGCGAYAGIPLTHRDHAQSCVFVTAHGRDGARNEEWPKLVRPGQTVVVYMGLSGIHEWRDSLDANNVDLQTPVAVIDNGTRPNQRVVTGTVATIADAVKAANLRGPSIGILGSVVSLRDQFNWYKHEGPTFQMGIGTALTDPQNTD